LDNNDFFHQATLKICGNLEIEKALQMLLHFLKDSMPVKKIFLQFYDHDYRSMRSIAYADEIVCKKLDLLTPLSKSAIKKAQNAPKGQDAFLFEDPNAFPISQDMTKFHGIEATSIIVMILRTKNETLGYLVFISEDGNRFKREDLDSVSLIKEPLIIAMSNALKHREVLKLNDLLADDNRYLHGELRRLFGDEIVGANFGLKKVMQHIQQVASLNSPVLLLGETGVGKDVVANTIHYSSSRSTGPFVSVNCGAIPDTMIDSELFGHERGAFTGALSLKRGRFERAHKGTIFLDEIGELPPQAQVRLLRVLQNKEIERIGGTKTIALDIRIISATNRDLEEMVRLNQFREDLWFRLNVFPILIPPLRERRLDIPALIQHFVNLKSKELKLPAIPTLGSGAAEQMMHYNWPGNVRELQNVIERALILNPKGPLYFDQLNIDSKISSSASQYSKKSESLDEVMSQHILSILSKTKGRISGPQGAAKLLGINASTLRNRMKKLGIKY
jgi:formate hydrogenlyase transcriptional activator